MSKNWLDETSQRLGKETSVTIENKLLRALLCEVILNHTYKDYHDVIVMDPPNLLVDHNQLCIEQTPYGELKVWVENKNHVD